MYRILFFVKNGIGFGHIRRALNVAEAISTLVPDIDIMFISQASSLKLFEGVPYKAVNLPLLHRLPTNIAEKFFKELLNEFVKQYRPTVVVEDTHPDEWCLSIPAVRNIPKILLLRRIDPLAIDDYLEAGYIGIYDMILIANEEALFRSESQSAECELIFTLSSNFHFVGPIFKKPSDEEIKLVCEKYPTKAPLIVVNAGAGGEHLAEKFCLELFSTMTRVAHEFETLEIDAHFVIVLGPYFKGVLPSPTANMTIVSYEPLLPALLAIASVAILRGGYNVVYEALGNGTPVIFIPSASYLENQPIWSQWLAARYNLHVCEAGNEKRLSYLIRQIVNSGFAPEKDFDRQLNTSSPPPLDGSDRHSLEPNQLTAARHILQLCKQYDDIEYDNWLRGTYAYFLFGGLEERFVKYIDSEAAKYGHKLAIVNRSDSGSYGNTQSIDSVTVVRRRHDVISPGPQLLFMAPEEIGLVSADEIVAANISTILFTNKPSSGRSARHWYRHVGLKQRKVLGIELFHFDVSEEWPRELAYRLRRFSPEPAPIYVDFTHVSSTKQLKDFLSNFTSWVSDLAIQLISTRELISHLISKHLKEIDAVDLGLEIDKIM